MISTSEQCVKHLFTGWNTQHVAARFTKCCLPSMANCEPRLGPDQRKRTPCWTGDSPTWNKNKKYFIYTRMAVYIRFFSRDASIVPILRQAKFYLLRHLRQLEYKLPKFKPCTPAVYTPAPYTYSLHSLKDTLVRFLNNEMNIKYLKGKSSF